MLGIPLVGSLRRGMALFFVAYVLGLRVRASLAMREGFYWLAIVYGAQRFVWEFFKPYPTLVGPFNHFHLMCAGLVVYGIAMIVRARRAESAFSARG